MSRLAVASGLAVLLLIITACSQNNDQVTLAPAAQLPAFLDDAPQTVRESYQFALAHPDELAKYPCYCGCGAMGHTSNLSCYIQEVSSDGSVVFDNHAAGCGICVDITQDVMRLMGQGKSAPEIRAYIDATYSPFGPSTDTPLPES